MKELHEFSLEIVYREKSIRVEEVEEIGGHLDDLRDFNDTLFRDQAGNYYLRQERFLKMPPNAEVVFSERLARCDLRNPEHDEELNRLCAWRQRLTKRTVSIKRIQEKTAVLWWVHNWSHDEQIGARLREAVIEKFSNEGSVAKQIEQKGNTR